MAILDLWPCSKLGSSPMLAIAAHRHRDSALAFNAISNDSKVKGFNKIRIRRGNEQAAIYLI
jgi:hypothetical protein